MKKMLRINLINGLLITIVGLSPLIAHASNTVIEGAAQAATQVVTEAATAALKEAATAAVAAAQAANAAVTGVATEAVAGVESAAKALSRSAKSGLLQDSYNTMRSFASHPVAQFAAFAGAIISLPFMYHAYLDYREGQKPTSTLISDTNNLLIHVEDIVARFNAIANIAGATDLETKIDLLVTQLANDKQFPYVALVEQLEQLLGQVNRQIRVIEELVPAVKLGADRNTLNALSIRLHVVRYSLTYLHTAIRQTKEYSTQAKKHAREAAMTIEDEKITVVQTTQVAESKEVAKVARQAMTAEEMFIFLEPIAPF